MNERAPRRRVPRQKRSQATHDAIVEAAARVFAEVGVAKATTARIAEVGGVSPGSMYQYFPSKEALVTAVVERELLEQTTMFVALASEIGVGDVPALIRRFVEASVSNLEQKRDLYRVLFEELPRVSGFGALLAADRRIAEQVRHVFELTKDALALRDLDAGAIVLARAFRYTVTATLEEPFADANARGRFIDEVSDMLATYLLLPRPWR